jgi:omega-6 fatty acid desaturase (delta-12 desaturase)
VDQCAQPHLGLSLLSLATSLLPFLAGWVLMYLALDVSYLLTLALAVPTAGFLVRTYILFHDCAHGSLLPGKRANSMVGAFLGLFVATLWVRLRDRSRRGDDRLGVHRARLDRSHPHD